MSLLNDCARVSRSRPCPLCDHKDWCLVSKDSEAEPSHVICARVESSGVVGMSSAAVRLAVWQRH